MGDGAFCHYCRKSLCHCEDYLREVAQEFAEGILDGRDSTAMCYAVSAPLEGFLSFFGYEVKLAKGFVQECEHYWLELSDGRIIDATADQFIGPTGKRMPKVYIGERPEWYQI